MIAALKELVPLGSFSARTSLSSLGIDKQLIHAIDDFTSPAVLLSFDACSPKIIYANKLHEKLTGYSTADLIGQTPKIFQGDLVPREVKDTMRNELLNCGFWNGFVLNVKKTGEIIHIQLAIFSILHNGEKYFVAIKRKRK